MTLPTPTRRLPALRRVAAAAALAALALSATGCSQASGHEREPACPKGKYDAVYFAVDRNGSVVTIPTEELGAYQSRGYRPASQAQAQAYVRRECPAGFR